MKKLLSLALVAVMAMSLLVGCGSDTSSTPANDDTSSAASTPANDGADADTSTPAGDDGSASGTAEFAPIKIGFATNSVGEQFIQMQEAFDSYIGDTLNVEFIYSEALLDAGAMITFIENAASAGCVGIISNLSNAHDAGSAKCEELGLWYVGCASADPENNLDLPHYLSVIGAANYNFSEAYENALDTILNDGEEHSVLVLSGAAPYGATSFIEMTVGTLEALQKTYDLTYTQDVHEMATTATQIDVENDKGMKITVFPGTTDLATNVSPLLQTGDYDVLVGTLDVTETLSVAVDEVERAVGMDIKVVSNCSISDRTRDGFNNTDSQGSPVLDAVIIGTTFERVAGVLAIRNAVDGFADQMRNGGQVSRITGMGPLVITSAEEYNQLAADGIPYSYITTDDLLSLCDLVNPDVTWEDINNFGIAMNAESLMEKFS